LDSIIPHTTEQQIKKGCIIGTHTCYKATPWDDPTIDRISLNDAYVLPDFRNISSWVDLHPIPEMVFRPKGERRVRPEHAPVGAYLRPEGHLEWLKTRSFPVYLHDCHEAGCYELPLEKRSHTTYPFPKWPNARPFPFKAIQQRFGTYFSSTPAWMLACMLMEGYRHIHITGIALATEWEYIHQRPNMEFLIGMALAQGVQFVIPDKSSLLKGKHKYALEHKPNLGLERIDRRVMLLKEEGQYLQKKMAGLSWYARGQKADILARLRVLELELADCRQEQARLAALARVA
jgi:hypothetical protein